MLSLLPSWASTGKFTGYRSFVNLPEEAQEGETLQLFSQQVTCVIVQKIDINLVMT